MATTCTTTTTVQQQQQQQQQFYPSTTSTTTTTTTNNNTSSSSRSWGALIADVLSMLTSVTKQPLSSDSFWIDEVHEINEFVQQSEFDVDVSSLSDDGDASICTSSVLEFDVCGDEEEDIN